jgi:endonuclease-3
VGIPRAEPRATWPISEGPATRRRRAGAVLRALSDRFPEAHTALTFRNPFELLVATILSAQSTDRTINTISPALFARFPTPEAVLSERPGELEDLIRRSGFFNQKARNIRGAARVLVEEFDGQVPSSMEELLRLPGVARKTANVVLANAFGLNEGIAVDTHVHRLSRRLSFSDAEDPVQVERDLMPLFPKPRWGDVTHLLIEHGRATCIARNPRCEECVIARWCPSARIEGRPLGEAPGRRRLASEG